MPMSTNLRLRPDQLLKLEEIMGRAPVTSAVGMDGLPRDPWSWQDTATKTAQRFDKVNRSQDAHNQLVTVGKIASAAPFALAGGAALLGGSGAASAAGAATSGALPGVGTGATAGATGGVLGRLGSIFGSTGFQVGTNAALSLLGMRSQNKANDQARADTIANQTKMIELEQQRLAAELQNANLDRDDARALNAAIQDLEQKKFALAQEQAQFERGEYEKKDARMEPYRQVSLAAQRRLASMLGL